MPGSCVGNPKGLTGLGGGVVPFQAGAVDTPPTGHRETLDGALLTTRFNWLFRGGGMASQLGAQANVRHSYNHQTVEPHA